SVHGNCRYARTERERCDGTWSASSPVTDIRCRARARDDGEHRPRYQHAARRVFHSSLPEATARQPRFRRGLADSHAGAARTRAGDARPVSCPALRGNARRVAASGLLLLACLGEVEASERSELLTAKGQVALPPG